MYKPFQSTVIEKTYMIKRYENRG